jgi:hypothetical protein
VVAYLVFTGTDGVSVEKNAVIGGVVAVIAAFSAGSALYVGIRTAFSTFPLLVDETLTKTGKSYVLEGWKFSKGKFWKILFLLIPFALAVSVAEGLLSGFESGLESSRTYANAVRARAEAGSEFSTDSEFVKGYFNRFLEPEEIREAVEILSNHEGLKEGVDREFFKEISPYLDLSKLDSNARAYGWLFNMASFFLLDGLMTMAWLSIYLRLGGKLRAGKLQIAEKPKPTSTRSPRASKKRS